MRQTEEWEKLEKKVQYGAASGSDRLMRLLVWLMVLKAHLFWLTSKDAYNFTYN